MEDIEARLFPAHLQEVEYHACMHVWWTPALLGYDGVAYPDDIYRGLCKYQFLCQLIVVYLQLQHYLSYLLTFGPFHPSLGEQCVLLGKALWGLL
eukprot:m.238508 g.238508  ORF g.238508 m.238508 type:complete len:95 (-) comp17429_c0_seq19:1101-1385(-)